MPFIPHTQEDVEQMLSEIGVSDIDSLFDEISQGLTNERLDQVPKGMSELEMLQHMALRAEQDQGYTCFLGGGSYDHHIPSAVWDLTTRGEFMTAYTPYQAEASQGTLQLIYEYQSMIVALTGMEVSNASVYDGASGLAEAVLMAVRANKKNKTGKVLIAQTVHPHYSQTTRNIVQNQRVEIQALPLHGDGLVDASDISVAPAGEAPAAIVIQQPNFFGLMEDVDALTNWGHKHNALVIAVVNPMSLGILKPPSEWGDNGADIVCGDGQPFGVPMASGGPSFGFISSRKAFMRQLPGRIIGRTEDLDGRVGYALTLQAREQHIRRGKATSNICTNQGLLVTAGTIYMSLMGPQGIRETAITCHRKAVELQQRLLQIKGIKAFFPGAFFHEFALRLPVPATDVVQAMMTKDFLPGLVLEEFDDGSIEGAEYGLLVAVTEKRTAGEIDKYVQMLSEIVQAAELAPAAKARG
jgi:glycine dehydrogenase subunit 1